MLLSISKNCWSWLFWLRDFFFPPFLIHQPWFSSSYNYKWVSVVNPRGVKLPNWQPSRLPLLVRHKYILKESLIKLSSFLLSIKLHPEKLQYKTLRKELLILWCNLFVKETHLKIWTLSANYTWAFTTHFRPLVVMLWELSITYENLTKLWC